VGIYAEHFYCFYWPAWLLIHILIFIYLIAIPIAIGSIPKMIICAGGTFVREGCAATREQKEGRFFRCGMKGFIFGSGA
jgi:hypothetical protein